MQTPIAAYREIFCVETVNFTLGSQYENLIPHNSHLVVETEEQVSQGMFGFKKKGILSMNASLRVPKVAGLATGVWQSGGIGMVAVEITNHGPREVRSANLGHDAQSFAGKKIKDFSTGQG